MVQGTTGVENFVDKCAKWGGQTTVRGGRNPAAGEIADYFECCSVQPPKKYKEIHHLRVKPLPDAAAPAPAAAGHEIQAEVDLYDQPGGEGNVIGTLKQGDKYANVTCRSDNWCQVAGKGWIWGDFVKPH